MQRSFFQNHLNLPSLDDRLWDAACTIIRGPDKLSAAAALVEADHSLVRFYLLEKARWNSIEKTTTGLGQALTGAMRAANWKASLT